MRVCKYAIIVSSKGAEKKEVAEMILNLVKFGIAKKSIRVYVSDDENMKENVENLGDNDNFPYLFIYGRLFGDIEAVRKGMEDDSLKEALMNNPYVVHKPKEENEVKEEVKVENEEIKEIKQQEEVKQEEIKEVKEEVKEEVVEQKEVKEEIKQEINESSDEPKQEIKEEDTLLKSVQEDYHQMDVQEVSFNGKLEKLIQSYTNKIEEEKYELNVIDDYTNENNEEDMDEDDESNFFELKIPSQYQFNLNDKWLNSCEWLLRTLSGNTQNKQTVKNGELEYLEEKKGDENYIVMQTNWYWRHQIRVYRFRNDALYRLDEKGYIHQRIEYKDIKEIVKLDTERAVLKIENCNDQYLQCSKLDKFVECLSHHIVLNNSKVVITVVH